METPGGKVALTSGFGCASGTGSSEEPSANARSARAERAGEPYFVTGVAGALGFVLFGSGAVVPALAVSGGAIALGGIGIGGGADTTLSTAGSGLLAAGAD
jgi:hypothetical protein